MDHPRCLLPSLPPPIFPSIHHHHRAQVILSSDSIVVSISVVLIYHGVVLCMVHAGILQKIHIGLKHLQGSSCNENDASFPRCSVPVAVCQIILDHSLPDTPEIGEEKKRSNRGDSFAARLIGCGRFLHGCRLVVLISLSDFDNGKRNKSPLTLSRRPQTAFNDPIINFQPLSSKELTISSLIVVFSLFLALMLQFWEVCIVY
jgi:hypothetical protein